MLDRKTKEKIYYSNDQTKIINDRYHYVLNSLYGNRYTALGIAILLIIILIANLDNTPPTSISVPAPASSQTETVSSTDKRNIEEPKSEKVYSEAEKNADLKEYKDKFVSRVKQHWNPGRESFLIDNSTLSVQIDKQGNIKFQNDTTSDDAASTIMRQAVSDGQPYSALPKSYKADTLSLTLYFEGNTDSYWGNSQPKSTYQVSLSPIKPTNKYSTNISEPQKSTLKNESINEDNLENNTDTKKYSVYIGLYASLEQATLAKEIILESDKNLPVVIKQLGANQYTISAGTYNNKASAEAMYNTLIKNSCPARIVMKNSQ